MRTSHAGHGRRARLIAGLGVLFVGSLAVTAGTNPAGAASPATAAAPGSMNFDISHPPDSSAGAHTADEPSIGSNWKSGAAMYIADTTIYRVTYDAAGNATWTDASGNVTSVTSFDPILFTDHDTGRTFVSQLDLACSLFEFTDDDGATWIPGQGCAQNGSEDHQSVGGGPLHAPLPTPPAPAYQHGLYYCNQDGGLLVVGGSTAAYCGLSVDGGVTFGPAVDIYTFQQCGGLHGHVRVAPDGTAVVPNQNCAPTADPTIVYDPLNVHIFPNQAAVVSTNNGATWSVHTIPGSFSSLRSDPSVAFDGANKMYFGYEDGVYANNDVNTQQIGGHALIATSTDNGSTWSTPVDVGAPFGIQNVTFPEVIAGDAGRAAYAFLGSSTAGDPENTAFQGYWYLYVAITTDGGTSWTVQNLTPNDPVERACIFLAGDGSCPSSKRNLLDFMDITVDNHGRVLVGYADGCTGLCVTQQNQPCADTAHICASGSNKSTDAYSSIARESCGPVLLAQFDNSLACTLSTDVPELPWTPAVLLLGAIGVATWRRQVTRRRSLVS